MAHPFIIWTFQRTGGTSLSQALGAAIAPAPVLQEPFNPGRDFGLLARTLRNEPFADGVQALASLLDSGVSLKHCFELRSRRLNQMLLSALSANRKYRNILLGRQHEVDRVCSLYLAKQTAVWGKWKVKKGGYEEVLAGRKKLQPFPVDDMLQHSLRCLDYRDWLLRKFAEKDIDYIKADFEEIYSGNEQARLDRISRVFDYIGARFDQRNSEALARILSGKQGSKQLYAHVPNYDEARSFLQSGLNSEAQPPGT